MNVEELKNKIITLSIWKKGDQRAPHKPLLILLALGELQNNNSQYLSYEEVREKLINLLKDFGPIRKSYHPEEPFVRLNRDGIWNLSLEIEKVKISDKWLLSNSILAGFNDSVYKLFTKNKNLIREIANIVLNEHFPESIHEDILTAVGLNFDYYSKKVRDPLFRDKVLKSYEYSCAVCGFNVRLGQSLVGVEAAHIKWHQAGGPDIENNGIALCSMHHKLYDRGVFTITNCKEVIVSENAYGTNGFDEWLMKFHGKSIRSPINPGYQPDKSYINWHIKEVFKGPARYMIG